MTEQRDLTADLATCAAATSGPWSYEEINKPMTRGWYNVIGGETLADISERIDCFEDAQFIAEARIGWPEAIKRAMSAEERCASLDEQLAKLAEFAAGRHDAIKVAEARIAELEEKAWMYDDLTK